MVSRCIIVDPNVGYCLLPAPIGSCPEENYRGTDLQVGSTHGRDPAGRRLIPVLLKDVAGLVPGAYQGRGRGVSCGVCCSLYFVSFC